MAAKPLPPVDTLRQLLHYEPETGRLFWKNRTPDKVPAGKRGREAVCKTWNTKFAGSEAFPLREKEGYKYGRVCGRNLMAHRVAYAIHHGHDPLGTIDHINGDRSDNRIRNLRDCPMRVNAKNLSLRKDNKFGSPGISYKRRPKSGKNWFASIRVDGKSIYLGTFATLEDAISARRSAERRYGFHEGNGKPGRGYYRR
jgi:hypothetical protein